MKSPLKIALIRMLAASVGATCVLPLAQAVAQNSPTKINKIQHPANTSSELHTIKIQAYRVFTSEILTPKQLVDTSQPAESVSRSMIELFGPQAGGTPALSLLPNVSVSGYNNDSQVGRSQISMRGIKVGYNSEPGDLTTNAITVELDGVPLNGLGQSTTWRSPEDPMGALMAGQNVIIGPGNPSERWYDSLGGTIDFIPIQPTTRAGGVFQLGGGSYEANDISAAYNTGSISGWSTVFAGASSREDSFRTTADALPTNNEELYIKTRHQFSNGSISFGGYYNHDYEWRPNWIPLKPQPLLDNEGLGIGTPYSEQTSGFYATMPRPLWHKTVLVQTSIFWSHLHLELSRTLKLSNMAWVRIGKDEHDKTELYAQNPNSPFYDGNPRDLEHYNIHSWTFGDRLALRKRFNRMETLSWGGYFVSELAKDTSPDGSTFEGDSWAIPLYIQNKAISSFYWSAFAQDDFRPLRRLKIVPGVAVEQFFTSYSNTSLAQACSDYARINNGQCPVPGNYYTVNGNTFQYQGIDTSPSELTDYLRVEPSIGANFLVGRGVHFYANYASTYKAPNAQDRLDETHLEVQTLKPVRSEEYDIGVRYAALRLGIMRRVYASVDVFHMLLSNETLTYSTAQNPEVTYFGYGSAVYKGVDLSLRAAFGTHWFWFLNLGYLKDRWNEFAAPETPSGPQPTGYGLPVSNSPKDTLNAGISYLVSLPFLRRTRATLWDQYVGSRYLFSNEIGMPTNYTNPAYDLLNFSISARIPSIEGLRHSVISVQVLNLANREYNSMEYISAGGDFGTPTGGYALAFPGAPRMVFASLTAHF